MVKEVELSPDSLQGIDGIGDTTIKTLENNGIITMYDVIALSPTTIASFIKGDDDKATKIFSFCKKFLIEKELIWDTTMSAADLYKKQNELTKLSTGCEGLDYLLDGGIMPMGITQCYGEAGGGKTQLGTELALIVQTPPDQGGYKTKDDPPITVIIDTENKYAPKRMIQMAIARGMAKNEEEALVFLNNIKLLKPKTVSEQLFMISRVREWLSSGLDIKLLIVDSVSALIRAEYSERGANYIKKNAMNSMFLQFRGIAETFKIPVVIMNQIYNSPDFSSQFGDPDHAYGGNILDHAVGTNLKLEATQGHVTVKGLKFVKHKARIIKSAMRGEEEVQFYIDDAGLHDVDKVKKTDD